MAARFRATTRRRPSPRAIRHRLRRKPLCRRHSAQLAPDETFDRQWALTLLDLTVNRLRAEFAAAGKPGDFEALKDCLMAERGAIDYAAVAQTARA